MDEGINFFVGLDVHKDSIAFAVCEAGREPSWFVGILRPDVQGVLKTLRKYGSARQVSVVYEAWPTRDGLHRELTRRGYRTARPQQGAATGHPHALGEGPATYVFTIRATVEPRRAGQQGVRGGGAGAGWIRLLHCAAGYAQHSNAVNGMSVTRGDAARSR